MWDNENFQGGMRDKNITARPGDASFQKWDTG